MCVCVCVFVCSCVCVCVCVSGCASCVIGGHLEGAAGVCGLAKIVKMLEHKQAAPFCSYSAALISIGDSIEVMSDRS